MARGATQHQAACIGGTLDASCRYIIDVTGSSVSVDELTEMLLAGMVEHFRAGLPLHDGALELVDAVRATRRPTALVSSSYRRPRRCGARPDRRAALRRLGRRRRDHTGKPHPEPYLTACEKLSVDPTKCVALEDAASGVQSAEAAGCVVVAVPSVAAIEALPTRPVVSSLTDIDVDWLLALPCS